MLCSSLESTGATQLKAPETALLEKIRAGSGEITDRFLVNFVEHQISRIEVSWHDKRAQQVDHLTNQHKQTCISTLALRNMIRPFKDGMLNQACPMADILTELSGQLQELKQLKEQADIDMAPS